MMQGIPSWGFRRMESISETVYEKIPCEMDSILRISPNGIHFRDSLQKIPCEMDSILRISLYGIHYRNGLRKIPYERDSILRFSLYRSSFGMATSQGSVFEVCEDFEPGFLFL